MTPVRRDKINILFMIDQLAGYGGTERHLIHLVGKLDKTRYNCVVVPFDTNEEYLKLSNLGVEVIPLKIPRCYTPNVALKAFRLLSIIKSRNIDIVQTYQFIADTYGVVVSRLSRAKHVISSRRDMGFKKGRIQIAIHRVMNRHIDRFITVSDAVGEWLAENEGVSRERQVTIRNGIDLAVFEALSQEERDRIREGLGLRESDFVVGIVGHMRPEKGHEMFFEAAYRLSKVIPNVKFVVVGLGPLYDHFRTRVKENGIDDRTLFAGYVSDARKYIEIFDVACLTSNTEGFSNAILEYMALKKPVVATSVGGNREAIVDGYDGYIVPPKSPEVLVDRILALHRDPELRERMGRRARKTVEERFTVEGMVDAHDRLYEKTLGRSRGASIAADPAGSGHGG